MLEAGGFTFLSPQPTYVTVMLQMVGTESPFPNFPKEGRIVRSRDTP